MGAGTMWKKEQVNTAMCHHQCTWNTRSMLACAQDTQRLFSQCASKIANHVNAGVSKLVDKCQNRSVLTSFDIFS